ncbi:ABC transporter ATP-binding protein [Paracoccus binzhouensis]|uniref:ABC transporter ATP-binding protein n=1 Tax=Paracoccus binzhouensis TaxID=2796149 RepID=UPI0018EED64F|nr:oligopeptide/dipeptide ABC transporter ATP-binding protein [Paracoccus binzhouensis]
MNTVEQTPLLELKGIKKYFDVSGDWSWLSAQPKYLKAIDGIDLKVYPGETLGIVGESGCGKSTTGNVIAQLLNPTEGDVLFEGESLCDLAPRVLRRRRKDFQMIFQDPFSSLNPRMRVRDLIAEPLRSHRIASGKQLHDRVVELMKAVGLSPSFIDRFPHEFSGGQRQRIGIARALALQPKLIVCDEVVSALDVSIQAQILNLLSKLQKEFDLTYIFISHGLPAIKHISDRIAVMYLGRIVELATKEQLFSRPRHPYTEALLSAVPLPDPEAARTRKWIVLQGDIPSPVNTPPGCSFHTRCPYARDKCKQAVPTMQALEDGHAVSCHFPLEGPYWLQQ